MVADLTNDNISKHMQRVLDDGRAKATANKDRAQLLTLWRFASQNSLHSGWPDVAPEKEPIRQPRAWLLEDIDRLLATVRHLSGTLRNSDIPQWIWWNTLILICLDTGERIGAVTAAEWDWIDRDWLLVPAEVRKGGKRDKLYKLSRDTMQSIAVLRDARFTRETAPSTILRQWLKDAHAAAAAGPQASLGNFPEIPDGL